MGKTAVTGKVEMRVEVCLLLLPSADPTLGKMPLQSDPFVWSDLQSTPPGIPEYPKTKSRIRFHSSYRAQLEECFFHLPNIVPFQ